MQVPSKSEVRLQLYFSCFELLVFRPSACNIQIKVNYLGVYLLVVLLVASSLVRFWSMFTRSDLFS